MVKRIQFFIICTQIKMKYIISFYQKNLDGLKNETIEQIIDNNRPSIITRIIPYSYCSMCGGTGRCGVCQG
jgi:hypothetical protein